MHHRALRANITLLFVSMIWGVGFVAQDIAMHTMPPYGFNAIRMYISGIILIPCIHLLAKIGAKKAKPESENTQNTDAKKDKKTLIVGGIMCGLFLFLGSGLQQLGIRDTSAGAAGFVTALYIVLVPLVSLLFGKRARKSLWLAVFLCLSGLYLLCVTNTNGFSISKGNLELLSCAVAYTGHILTIDHFSKKTDPVKMSCIQFFVTGTLFLVVSLFTESFTVQNVLQCAAPILYAGLLSGGLGYTLQIVAQRDTDPTIASLIMCLESVFAVLAGFIILGDILSTRELIGCSLMLVGILFAQLPGRKKLNT